MRINPRRAATRDRCKFCGELLVNVQEGQEFCGPKCYAALKARENRKYDPPLTEKERRATDIERGKRFARLMARSRNRLFRSMRVAKKLREAEELEGSGDGPPMGRLP